MNILFQNKYRIESIRLRHWDYSSNGYYFITICTKDREYFFGDINNDQMELSEIGNIANNIWNSIPSHHPNIQLDAFVIMPNHIHGIVIIDENPHRHRTHDNDARRDVARNVSTPTPHQMSLISPKSGSLGTIIRSYKSVITNWCRKNGHEYFAWQTRFYEHIIRNEAELERVRNYIIENPIKWDRDRNNSVNICAACVKISRRANNANI